jgi:hypothetical protein
LDRRKNYNLKDCQVAPITGCNKEVIAQNHVYALFGRTLSNSYAVACTAMEHKAIVSKKAYAGRKDECCEEAACRPLFAEMLEKDGGSFEAWSFLFTGNRYQKLRVFVERFSGFSILFLRVNKNFQRFNCFGIRIVHTLDARLRQTESRKVSIGE